MGSTGTRELYSWISTRDNDSENSNDDWNDQGDDSKSSKFVMTATASVLTMATCWW